MGVGELGLGDWGTGGLGDWVTGGLVGVPDLNRHPAKVKIQSFLVLFSFKVSPIPCIGKILYLSGRVTRPAALFAIPYSLFPNFRLCHKFTTSGQSAVHLQPKTITPSVIAGGCLSSVNW